MIQTLFLKDSKLFIRLKQGEYLVENPEVLETAPKYTKWGKNDSVEWPYGVELIKMCASDVCDTDGACEYCREPKTLARLLPKEKKSESAYKEGEESEDRIKAWQEKAAEVLLIRTDRQADEEDYYVAGCEHVWDTHVIPLQRELDNEIKIREEYFEDAQLLLEDKRRLQSENKALRDEIMKVPTNNRKKF